MTQTFTITNFMANRWKEASTAVNQNDPAFIKALSSYDSLLELGFHLPTDLPNPNVRLSKDWYDLLESTVDIFEHLDRIEMSIQKINRAPNRKEAIYYFHTWVQDIWNLGQKLKVLVSHTCSIHSLTKKQKENYRDRVSNVVKPSSGLRTGLVHGVSNLKENWGTSSRAITEDKLWEGTVIWGFEPMSKYWLNSPDHPPPDWCNDARQTSEKVYKDLGEILKELDGAIETAQSGQS